MTNWPVFSAREMEAVQAVLQSGKVNYWTGDQGKHFEQEFAEYCAAPFAIAAANGTVTLDMALRALRVGPGDEVIVTPRSYFASASAIALLGARPVFADVDLDSQNMTAETIAPALSERTRAILVVHLAGWPSDMRAIMELADSHGVAVIEDCAQAHGARIDGQHVGTFGSFGSFSFCQDKIMTTGGEGGMLITMNEELFEFVRSFKDHGKNFEKMGPRPGQYGFRYVHDGLGTNYRMTEMQSAIGREQLRLLDDWLATRTRNAMRWASILSEASALRIPLPDADRVRHAFYKFYAFVDPEALRHEWSRDRLVSELNDEGVRVFTGSCPEIYREVAFADAPEQRRLPSARALGETSLMLLVDPTIDEFSIEDNARKIVRKLKVAQR
ncbi:MAG: DegT/DnrJ/EryC1/StrS aminotransferase family protein [Pseudomonadota bacterium]